MVGATKRAGEDSKGVGYLAGYMDMEGLCNLWVVLRVQHIAA